MAAFEAIQAESAELVQPEDPEAADVQSTAALPTVTGRAITLTFAAILGLAGITLLVFKGELPRQSFANQSDAIDSVIGEADQFAKSVGQWMASPYYKDYEWVEKGLGSKCRFTSESFVERYTTMSIGQCKQNCLQYGKFLHDIGHKSHFCAGINYNAVAALQCTSYFKPFKNEYVPDEKNKDPYNAAFDYGANWYACSLLMPKDDIKKSSKASAAVDDGFGIV